jgi:hypothetical protein
MHQNGGFLRVFLFPPPLIIAEILLKVALNTITLTLMHLNFEHNNSWHRIKVGIDLGILAPLVSNYV